MPENRRQALRGHQETSATVMLLAPKTVTASNLTHVVFRVSKCTYVGNTRKRFLIVQCKKPGGNSVAIRGGARVTNCKDI